MHGKTLVYFLHNVEYFETNFHDKLIYDEFNVVFSMAKSQTDTTRAMKTLQGVCLPTRQQPMTFWTIVL